MSREVTMKYLDGFTPLDVHREVTPTHLDGVTALDVCRVVILTHFGGVAPFINKFLKKGMHSKTFRFYKQCESSNSNAHYYGI